MSKNLFKKTIIGLVFTITILIFHTQIIYATSNTKTVTTEKQLMAALKNKNVDKIIIKPTKTTVFNIGKKNYDKELTVYQDKTTLMNKGKFNRCEIIVTNTKQSSVAIGYIKKYHRSDETILHIMNAQNDIAISKNDLSSFAYLLIEKCNCNITNRANWKSIEIAGMGTGEFFEYGNINDINVTGDVKKITVAKNALTNQIYYNQKELQDITSNRIEVNGNIGIIKTKSNLDIYITGKDLDDIKSVISNETDDNIVVYVNDEKYIFDIDNNLVTNEDKDSDSGDADSGNNINSDNDGDGDTEDSDDEVDTDTGDSDDEVDTDTEDSDNEVDSDIDTSDDNDDNSSVEQKDTEYNYKEYTIELGDGKTSTVYGYFDEEASYNVYLKVNELRASLGLNALKWDTKMLGCAETRASELIQSYSHTRPNGSTCFSVLSANSISYRGAGENIAAGYCDVDAVMNGWTNSPGHYANMTNASYSKMTAGCIIAKDESDKQGYKYYWVQIFCN